MSEITSELRAARDAFLDVWHRDMDPPPTRDGNYSTLDEALEAALASERAKREEAERERDTARFGEDLQTRWKMYERERRTAAEATIAAMREALEWFARRRRSIESDIYRICRDRAYSTELGEAFDRLDAALSTPAVEAGETPFIAASLDIDSSALKPGAIERHPSPDFRSIAEELARALEPFARFAELNDANSHSAPYADAVPIGLSAKAGSTMKKTTLGDCRRAVAALSTYRRAVGE